MTEFLSTTRLENKGVILYAGVDPDRFTGFPETHQILLKNEHPQCICFYCVYYRFSPLAPPGAKFGGIHRKIEPNERRGFAYGVSHRVETRKPVLLA